MIDPLLVARDLYYGWANACVWRGMPAPPTWESLSTETQEHWASFASAADRAAA
jgi:hypothetical protein